MADEEEFQITDQETANTQVPVSEAAITESAVLAEVSQEPEVIYVDVSGAVVSPGVYCLDAVYENVQKPQLNTLGSLRLKKLLHGKCMTLQSSFFPGFYFFSLPHTGIIVHLFH